MTDPEPIRLTWHRFEKMSQACKDFSTTACVYVIADPTRTPLQIGSSIGLGEQRYRGGTASAFDAALHGSGNLVFAAATDPGWRVVVEKALIWAERPRYNKQGKIVPLSDLDAAAVAHDGDVPRFAHLARVPATA